MSDLQGRFWVFVFAGVAVLIAVIFGQMVGYFFFGAAAVGSYQVGRMVGAKR